MMKTGLISFLACLMLWLHPATLTASEALINSETYVDVTGRDAVDAREQAMEKAQYEALKNLITKLAPPGQVSDILKQLNAGKIESMARGTEILDEKINDNRYRARMLINFDAAEVSNLIANIAAVDGDDMIHAATSSFLVIPALEEDKTTLLWDDKNSWWQAWKSLAIETMSGDIIVPVGDNSDLTVVDVPTLAASNYSSLSPLAIRYGVSDIVVLNARLVRKPDMTLSVVKRRMNRTRNEVSMLSYRADPQETREMLLTRASRDIADNLHDQKSEEITTNQATGGGERGKVMILASITTLGSWTDLRNKLSALPMVDRIEMIAISPQQVDMAVYYRGTEEALAGAIVSGGLRLGKHANYWVVTRD